MLLYYSLGLNFLILFICSIIFIKQYLLGWRYKQISLYIKDQIQQLSKENHLVESKIKDAMIMHINTTQQVMIEKFSQSLFEQAQQAGQLREQLQQALMTHRTQFDERQFETLKVIQDTLQKGAEDNRSQIKQALADYAQELSKRVDALTFTTEAKLKDINHLVERRLFEGFEKTNETFNDVIKRLALIDAAQKKITELSSNVMTLQEILNDKRSRGAFGEVQLSALVRNMLPEQHFSLQHQLGNQRRPDCVLFLPEPTGTIAIDAKFPLENFRLMIDNSLSETDHLQAERQFKIDIRKHIQDIAEKYIVPNETADGAVMFIPAESVFAEIHAHHIDLVEIAQQAKVWMVSPTTLMAVLTTARAVLKDAATRQQIHEIQKHLRMLAEDFERFQMRMDNLAKRIAQAHSDVELVHISSRKITQRFTQIEKADLKEIAVEPILSSSDIS